MLCQPGQHSSPLHWRDVGAAAPAVIVFMPCGYDLEAATEESKQLAQVDELTATPAWQNGQVWVVDATSYFSRPGPRLIDGLEILAWVMHPDDFPEPPPGRVMRVTTSV